jgi:hypothetical protein
VSTKNDPLACEKHMYERNVKKPLFDGPSVLAIGIDAAESTLVRQMIEQGAAGDAIITSGGYVVGSALAVDDRQRRCVAHISDR